ncbi:MAG: stage IV sporulation protein A [Eubacteriales bacterium]|nr:stage IV sporulation protein A [Eubacteriales bacterium]
MVEYSIYNDISERTNGDVYIGVVGPVRTGKSTFIQRFMDTVVFPNMENEHERERAIDELPQSAQGRTIMTTEPKFVPNEAVNVSMDNNTHFKVRLIDCVGYIVPGATGYDEEDGPRMVKTPWFDENIPFEKAAELGTRKVISDHSTIGLVITTDGSITEIPREDYIAAEERVVKELAEAGKPFVVLLNSAQPYSDSCSQLGRQLREKYMVPVIPTSCAALDQEEINRIIEQILYEFPIQELSFRLPSWVASLEDDHWLKTDLLKSIKSAAADATRLREAGRAAQEIGENSNVESCGIRTIRPGEGCAELTVALSDELFYKMLSEKTGVQVENDNQLLNLFADYAATKKKYDRIAGALEEVKQKGYGIVPPTLDELTLEEPEIIKQGSRYGVRLRASAPSIHMVKANIETEVSPIVGTEKQSEELIKYLLDEFKSDPIKIWESNMFGKTLHELVNEGLHNKLSKMPDDARMKLQETLQKIINEGSGGLICIIL